MNETKWTPGPWFYEPEDRGDASVGIQPTPPYIYADPQNDGCVVPVCTMDSPCRATDIGPVSEYDEGVEWIGDHNANARLIAAAPELYEALQSAFEYLDAIPEAAAGGDDEAVRLARLARAALAKARGE